MAPTPMKSQGLARRLFRTHRYFSCVVLACLAPTKIYFALREEFALDHWSAIAAAEVEYLIPLLQWAHGEP